MVHCLFCNFGLNKLLKGCSRPLCRYMALFAMRKEVANCWRTAEGLAAALGAPGDRPFRGALALLHTLGLAATKSGHSYLPWGTLAAQTERLMASTGARDRASGKDGSLPSVTCGACLC